MLKRIESKVDTLQQILFEAMNTTVEIAFWGQEAQISRIECFARDWFEYAESKFSRFRPESELNQLNRLAGQHSTVSAPMLEILLLAENYRKLTEGIFNPLIAKALKSSGYDMSYDIVKQREITLDNNEIENRVSKRALTRKRLSQELQIQIDSIAKSVKLPDQRELDLGGIAKSWAVRGLASYFQNRFQLKRGLINAGGDLEVWGSSGADASPWLIGIENPWTPEDEVGILSLAEGSVATSSKLGRTWSNKQGKMHHLIDPRTMSPSTSNVVQCTVSGTDVLVCEIWAKVICILGKEQGLALFKRRTTGYEALIFTTDKQILFYGDKDSMRRKWLKTTMLRTVEKTKTLEVV